MREIYREIKEVKTEALHSMDLHHSFECRDGEIIKVKDGWLYIFNRIANNGTKVYLAPVFVPWSKQ
jgi:hypothetical protein